MSKSRSRRLRKKLHLDEFRELGFRLTLSWPRHPDEDTQDVLMEALLDEVILPRRLAYAGWIDGGLIYRAYRGSADQADRQAVSAWWQQRDAGCLVVVSELVDIWHS